ncbi:3-hydroxyisobutyrate dehydrogenase [Saccharothrix coeruleofusca]|uniref:3-hydroxyisobutyrate dehydrogenase n=1 Tax=Saccharothrix coeruleofusca TaxID=33919 RepID=A0A918ECV8_9PSEU|nr:3-hydroxyisobutyrate dehydrogenase [Saccharothrix coeruleofusca]
MAKTVALLGTGLMGAGMARSVLRAGFDVVVWNRTAARARPLADDGATVVEQPSRAVEGADVVVTMLFDADATAEVMAGVLPSMGGDAVWAQCGTVGLDGTRRLAELAREHGVGFVDSPVLGTRQPAENGQLVVLAGGPVALRDAVVPVFDAIGSRTVWAGERPGDGHRLKLAANAWVLSITAATAQSLALARGLGLDPASFLDVISGTATDSAYAQLKGRAMLSGDLAPSFGIDGAVKDSELILAAMRGTGADDRLMRALNEQYREAAALGDGVEDMAAVIRVHRG